MNLKNITSGSKIFIVSSSLLLLLISSLIVSSDSAKILALFPLQLKSHFIVFDSLMIKLAERGHNVTVFSGFAKNRKIDNYNEIIDVNCLALPNDHFDMKNLVPLKNVYRQLNTMFSYTRITEDFLNCDATKTLLNTTDEYDLLITELFITDTAFGLVNKFSVPYISLSANTPYPWTADRTGNPDNPSYITFNHNGIPLLNDIRHNSFWRRLHNTFAYLLAKFYHLLLSEYISDRVNHNRFGEEIPSYDRIAKNVSLILSYSHFSTHQPQPLVPNIIQIGGIQIENPRSLPSDIQKFIEESPHGVIYFSFGSLIKPDSLPEEKRQAFIYAFSKIPQRILWKWNGDLPGKPEDIYISKWLPQRDILAHPKVKLFITHGGSLGMNEAVYEGVPILGIPIFGDQNMNVQHSVSKGCGEFLNYYHISNLTVLDKIQLILNDSRYKENAMKLSAIYRDRPMSPLDTAVYWTEYVIRHNGAYHLRSAAVNLPWYQYLLLDVIAFIVSVAIVIILIFYYLLKLLIRFSFKKINYLYTEKESKKNN